MTQAMNEHKVTFGTLGKDGELSNVRLIKQSDIGRCPFVIFAPEHYRGNGSCKCTNAEHRKYMVKRWEYKPKDFRNIPLID